jgi:hypothetical protein
MSDVTDGGFPRRDARRRIVALRDLMAVTLAGAVAGAVALVLLDGLFALAGLGAFGRVNGWLAVILPVMLLVEEFRAWRGVRARLIVALASTVVAVGVGMLAAGIAGDLPGLVSGGLGAVGFTAAYPPIWFYGVRVLGDEVTDT